MITGRNIIMFGLQPWDIPIGSNFKNMAEEIAKHNNVLYVNRPLDRISYYRNSNNSQIKARIKSLKDGTDVLTEVKQNLTVFNPRVLLESINWLPAGFLYDHFNKRNSSKLAKEIKWAARELGFVKYLLIVDNDFFNARHLSKYLDADLFIYYIRDFLLSQHYFTKHGGRAEPAIMKVADGVAANSKYLANYAAKYNANTADIGQGCDVDDFLNSSKRPADMTMEYPIIGYCGSLTATRLDIELIKHIAQQKPEWNIVLVGPEDEQFRSSALHQLKNVHFPGAKQPAELPDYVHAFDVCINPQILNQMTIGNYPRKVDEYLAAGKPVVATKTEAMEMFASLCYLCETKDDYVNAISDALSENNNEETIAKRRSLAMSHTWEASVSGLYTLIKKLEDGRN